MKSTEEPTLYHSNVDLYDIAFDWDIEREVTWLLGRLGSQCHVVLEPGCGSGRMLEAFAKRGIEIVGIDTSRDAIHYAQKRIASMPKASARLGNMINFDLGRVFDGAICPINTLAHLGPKELVQHLDRMSRHLCANARYLVQLAIRDTKLEIDNDERGFEWEARRGDTHLRIRVRVEHIDYRAMRELQNFKITIEAGKRAGEVIEEKHWMTRWTAESWHSVISESQFTQHAQYDGDDLNFPAVQIGSTGNLMWHELIRK